MPAPHEIVAFPLTIYAAPTGTNFPAIDVAEGDLDGAWFKLGAEGAKNYEEDGVTVSHPQTIEEFIGAATTAARKAFRTEESLTVGFTLVDTSPEQYAKVLDDATVATVAAAGSTAGEKSFDLLRGIDVQQFALLARGQSSVDNELNSQLELPTVYQSGEPSPVYTKGSPAGLEVEFKAMEVVGGEFGTLRIQTDAAPS